jgi:hypothetical protein
MVDTGLEKLSTLLIKFDFNHLLKSRKVRMAYFVFFLRDPCKVVFFGSFGGVSHSFITEVV